MAEEKVILRGVDKTKQAFKSLNNNLDQSSKSVKKLGVSFGAFLGTGLLAKGIGDTILSVEKLRSSLKTATGSAEGAREAFDNLSAFAAKTPFDIEQVTTAFIKLKNLGLEPSEEALTSYGNTAVAMGKSLDQFIEAVADATTGEFERLKEFGIKSKSVGDNVKFTFQGITTTVGKNAEEIQGYLKGIGDTNFGGAMDEQAKTLVGAVSNMQDTFTRFSIAVGDAGLTELLTDVTKGISSLTDSLNTGSSPALRAAFEGVRSFGRSLGGLSASLVAFVSGDFKEAAGIAKFAWEDLKAGIEENPIKPVIELPKPPEQEKREIEFFDNEKFTEEIETRFLKLDQSLLTEEERIRLSYEQQLLDLENFAILKDLSNQEWAAKEAQLEERKQQAIRASRKKSSDQERKAQFQLASSTLTALGSLFTIMGAQGDAHSKKEFKRQKKMNIAAAVMNTAGAVVSAFNTTPFFPLGLIMGALALASGIAQVNKIKSTSFGGGGSPASIPSAGSAPSINVPPPVPGGGEPKEQKNVTFVLEGEGAPSDSYIRDKLLPAMQEAMDDGTVFTVQEA